MNADWRKEGGKTRSLALAVLSGDVSAALAEDDEREVEFGVAEVECGPLGGGERAGGGAGLVHRVVVADALEGDAERGRAVGCPDVRGGVEFAGEGDAGAGGRVGGEELGLEELLGGGGAGAAAAVREAADAGRDGVGARGGCGEAVHGALDGAGEVFEDLAGGPVAGNAEALAGGVGGGLDQVGLAGEVVEGLEREGAALRSAGVDEGGGEMAKC